MASASSLLESLFPVARLRSELVSSSWRPLPPVQIAVEGGTGGAVATPPAFSLKEPLFLKGAFHMVHGAVVVVSDLKGLVLTGSCTADAVMRRYEAVVGGSAGSATQPRDISSILMQLEDAIKGTHLASIVTPHTSQQQQQQHQTTSAASPSPPHSCVLIYHSPPEKMAVSSAADAFVAYVKGGGNPSEAATTKLHIMLPARLTESVSIMRPFPLDVFPLRSVVVNPSRLVGLGSTLEEQFIFEMVTSPMLRAQAALCGALTVLASQGRLSVDDFKEVFQHPVVRQHAQGSSITSLIGNTPTFWSIVTGAAFPAPASEEAAIGVGATASALGAVVAPQLAPSLNRQQPNSFPNHEDGRASNIQAHDNARNELRVAGKKAHRTETTTAPAAVVSSASAPPTPNPPTPAVQPPPPVVVDAKKKLRKALL